MIRKMFGEYIKFFKIQYLMLCGFYFPTLIRLCDDGKYFVSVLTYLLFILLMTIPAYLFFCVVAHITDELI